MAQRVWHFLVLSPVLLTCGCLAAQTKRDGNNFREAVADMYTDQAMDNLIRARCNKPFVQLKFSGLNVTDSDDYSVNGSLSRNLETDRDLFMAAAMRKLTNMASLGGMADRKRTLAFNADPVTDQNDVYALYLAFASNPELLMESDTKPECPVHELRKCGKKYYWIPCEAGPAFLHLVLQTALMRGPETAPVFPAAYEVKIVDVLNPSKIVDGERDIENATLVFDKPVPNGEGTLVVDLDDGRRVKATLWPVDKDEDGKKLGRGRPTTQLNAQWAPKRDGFTELNLQNRPGRVYSRDFPPEAPAPVPAVIGQISTNVNQIRINQLSGRR